MLAQAARALRNECCIKTYLKVLGGVGERNQGKIHGGAPESQSRGGHPDGLGKRVGRRLEKGGQDKWVSGTGGEKADAKRHFYNPKNRELLEDRGGGIPLLAGANKMVNKRLAKNKRSSSGVRLRAIECRWCSLAGGGRTERCGGKENEVKMPKRGGPKGPGLCCLGGGGKTNIGNHTWKLHIESFRMGGKSQQKGKGGKERKKSKTWGEGAGGVTEIALCESIGEAASTNWGVEGPYGNKTSNMNTRQ